MEIQLAPIDQGVMHEIKNRAGVDELKQTYINPTFTYNFFSLIRSTREEINKAFNVPLILNIAC